MNHSPDILTPHMPEMLSPEEVSERSGFPYSTIRKMCLKGEIVHIRVGRRYYINWDKFCQRLNGELTDKEGHSD